MAFDFACNLKVLLRKAKLQYNIRFAINSSFCCSILSPTEMKTLGICFIKQLQQILEGKEKALVCNEGEKKPKNHWNDKTY